MSLFAHNRVLVGALALALTMLVPALPVAAAKPGNSAHAKACYKGGWTQVATANGTSFADQSECVAYGAAGGTFAATLDVDGPCCDDDNYPAAQLFSFGAINGITPDPYTGDYVCATVPTLNPLPCHAGVTWGAYTSVAVSSFGPLYGGTPPVVTCPDGSTPTPEDRTTYYYVLCNFYMNGPRLVTITF